MAQVVVDASRALREVIRADVIVSGARALDAIAASAQASLDTLVRAPHRISVARDAEVPSLVRVTFAGPAIIGCIVIAV